MVFRTKRAIALEYKIETKREIYREKKQNTAETCEEEFKKELRNIF